MAECGAGRVFTQNIVAAFKEKPGTSNSEAKVRVRLVRRTWPPRGGTSKLSWPTPTVTPQWAFQSDHFSLDSEDCSDAHYMGTPYPMSDPRGRVLLGRILEGWEEFGYPQFNDHGEKL